MRQRIYPGGRDPLDGGRLAKAAAQPWSGQAEGAVLFQQRRGDGRSQEHSCGTRNARGLQELRASSPGCRRPGRYRLPHPTLKAPFRRQNREDKRENRPLLRQKANDLIGTMVRQETFGEPVAGLLAVGAIRSKLTTRVRRECCGGWKRVGRSRRICVAGHAGDGRRACRDLGFRPRRSSWRPCSRYP